MQRNRLHLDRGEQGVRRKFAGTVGCARRLRRSAAHVKLLACVQLKGHRDIMLALCARKYSVYSRLGTVWRASGMQTGEACQHVFKWRGTYTLCWRCVQADPLYTLDWI